ncbi:hypothetical protein K1719_037482 [Acacia pycnantha]|nr:hypothetical protein K1719_037482 [Acacia pycnantha]
MGFGFDPYQVPSAPLRLIGRISRSGRSLTRTKASSPFMKEVIGWIPHIANWVVHVMGFPQCLGTRIDLVVISIIFFLRITLTGSDQASF